MPVLLWPLIYSVSASLFDAPGATGRLSNWGLFVLLNLLPVAVILIGFLSFRRRRRRRYGAAIGLSLVPVVATVTLLASLSETDVRRELEALVDQNRRLIEWSRRGELGRIELAADNGQPLDVADADGSTPLTAAYAADQLAAFVLLLEHGADPNAHDRFDDNAAVYILADSRPVSSDRGLEFLRALLEHGLDPNLSDQGRSLIGLAASAGPPAYLELLLADGARPDRRDGYGRTPLEAAALAGRWENCLLLLPRDSGTNLDLLVGSLDARIREGRAEMVPREPPAGLLALLDAIEALGGPSAPSR